MRHRVGEYENLVRLFSGQRQMRLALQPLLVMAILSNVFVSVVCSFIGLYATISGAFADTSVRENRAFGIGLIALGFVAMLNAIAIGHSTDAFVGKWQAAAITANFLTVLFVLSSLFSESNMEGSGLPLLVFISALTINTLAITLRGVYRISPLH